MGESEKKKIVEPGFPQPAAKFASPERPLTKAFVVDGHVDLPFYMSRHADVPSLRSLRDGPFTLRKAKASDVRLFAMALYCDDRFNGEASYKHLQDILKFTLPRLHPIKPVRQKTDLERIKQDQDLMGTLLLLENADAIAESLGLVDELKQKGVRMVGLTHAGKNRLAQGNRVSFPDGLTKKGREVISALQENGFAIDVAHLHPRCFWELLICYEGPLISSHTGVRNVCDIPRNLDLEQVGEIIARGGIVGVTFNPEMLSPEGAARCEDAFIHMDVLVQRYGPAGVGIGSDFCGFDGTTEGLEDITLVRNLKGLMLKHGYGNEAAEDIMGLNWMRFYENHLFR